MLITLDGIDGVGKSTISALLKERLNAYIIKGVRDDYVDKLAYSSNHIDVKCLYYLASFIDSALDSKIERNEIIVFDKSFYSTIVYHKLLGSKINIEKILTEIVAPDLKVYLTCPRFLWQERLKKRNKIDWYEKQLLESEEFASKIEDAYSELGLIRIENINIEDTFYKIVDLIDKIK